MDLFLARYIGIFVSQWANPENIFQASWLLPICLKDFLRFQPLGCPFGNYCCATIACLN